MTFIEPRIGAKLAPIADSQLWIGLLSIWTAFFAIVQLLVNWKGRADNYQRSLIVMSGFVKGARPITKQSSAVSDAEVQHQLDQYRDISGSVESVPEKLFLALKKRHLTKVELSKMLDETPGANLLFMKCLLWTKHNWNAAREIFRKAP